MLNIFVMLCLLGLTGGAFVAASKKEKERKKEAKKERERTFEYEFEFVFEKACA